MTKLDRPEWATDDVVRDIMYRAYAAQAPLDDTLYLLEGIGIPFDTIAILGAEFVDRIYNEAPESEKKEMDDLAQRAYGTKMLQATKDTVEMVVGKVVG